MTTALAKTTNAIEPTNMSELREFAELAAASRFFGAESVGQALMIAMAGRDLGFSYTQAMRAFYCVKGKMTLSADGMVAACLASGQCDFFRAAEVTDKSATWETQRKGGVTVSYTFTMADAQTAGIAGDMYKKHPKRMLSARAKSYLARDVYPDVLMGLVTEDEAHEIAENRPTRPVVAVAVARTESPAAPVKDWDAIRSDLYSKIADTRTADELIALKNECDRAAPKGSPIRNDIVSAMTAQHGIITAHPVANSDEAAQ